MNDLLLLAMLLDEPKYGYQLKREAGWITGQDALHSNLVYPLLRRFLNDRIVVGARIRLLSERLAVEPSGSVCLDLLR